MSSKLSRRYTLSLFGASGVATALVISSRAIAHNRDRNDTIPEIVQAWADATSAGDANALAALYTDD